MHVDKSTFCAASWFQTSTRNDMSKRLCSVINRLPNDQYSKNLSPLEYLNSPEIIEIKKDLTQGKKNVACQQCWDKELKGIRSLRNMCNDLVSGHNFQKKNWVDSYFKDKKDFNSDLIALADIRVGNTCNHACVMCSPQDSTLLYNDWLKRKDSEFVNDALREDPSYFEDIKENSFKNEKYQEFLLSTLKTNKNIKGIRLLGGEPLLNKKILTSLKELDNEVKKKIYLTFITNGSVDIESTIRYIGQFRSIRICISLEGIGLVQEWARYGSDWNTLEKNILNMRDKNLVYLSINHALQTPTVPGFLDLINWCKKHQLYLGAGIVQRPNYLSLATLPTVLKNQIIEEVHANQDQITMEDSDEYQSFCGKRLINLIKKYEFDPDLFKRFQKYIKWYENNKLIPKIEDILPIWKKYL